MTFQLPKAAPPVYTKPKKGGKRKNKRSKHKHDEDRDSIIQLPTATPTITQDGYTTLTRIRNVDTATANIADLDIQAEMQMALPESHINITVDQQTIGTAD